MEKHRQTKKKIKYVEMFHNNNNYYFNFFDHIKAMAKRELLRERKSLRADPGRKWLNERYATCRY